MITKHDESEIIHLFRKERKNMMQLSAREASRIGDYNLVAGKPPTYWQKKPIWGH